MGGFELPSGESCFAGDLTMVGLPVDQTDFERPTTTDQVSQDFTSATVAIDDTFFEPTVDQLEAYLANA
jgi:hypothetical protein